MFYDERELVSRQGIFGSVFKHHAQPIRYFSYMHEDLSLISKNSIKKKKGYVDLSEGAETDIPLGAHWLGSVTYMASSRPMRNPTSKEYSGWHLRNDT